MLPELQQSQQPPVQARQQPVKAEDTPPPVNAESKSVVDKQQLFDALYTTKGNVQAAAREIGVSRVTLYAHIRRHGLSLESFRQY
jgi:transcriptional regulator of acetoin/glycerol metabolism